MEPGEPTVEERLEMALDLLVNIIRTHGPVYAHLFERLERELAELKQRNQAIEERVTRLLAASDLPPLEENVFSEPEKPKRRKGSAVETSRSKKGSTTRTKKQVSSEWKP